MQTGKLIRMAQRGDKSALDKLIRLYYDSVFSYCYHHVGNRQEAEDLCHDTFCSVLENLENYHHVGKFQNYLYVIAGNKCKNYYKKHRELLMETLPEQTQTLFEIEEGEEIKDLVRLLPEELQEVIILRFYQNLNYRSIAQIMGCSISTAKYRVKKALLIIKNEWEGAAGESK